MRIEALEHEVKDLSGVEPARPVLRRAEAGADSGP